MDGTNIAILGMIAFIMVVAWLTPGPNMLAVMSSSLSNGLRDGLLTSAGLAAGNTVWAIASVAGIAALFEFQPNLVFALRLAGAGYLIWLGFKALVCAATGTLESLSPSQSTDRGWQAFRVGFLVIITNPKTALFYGSILTAFIPKEAPDWMLLAVVLLSTTISFAGHSTTAALFSRPRVMRVFDKARRQITTAFGLLFCGLGLSVAHDTLKRLN